MESLTLEYKASGALKNDDHQKSELFKDVSAMANSQGGIIVYGMKERGHLPQGTDDGFDPRRVTREWIENVLTSNIQPKIEDLLIKPVILTSKGTGSQTSEWLAGAGGIEPPNGGIKISLII